MNWTNVKLIVQREIRDQLRDRRTIFVIAILPLLLYPFLGMSFLQVAQFMKEHPTKVWVIGAESLEGNVSLLADNAFRTSLLTSPSDERLFELSTDAMSASSAKDVADQAVKSGQFDAVVFFPPEFVQEINAFAADPDSSPPSESGVGPEVFYDVAKDKSRVAHDRVFSILLRWRSEILERRVEANAEQAKPQPFQMSRHDLSEDTGRRAALWSKILPFVVIVWAMTGAFYPAIDLCAGEKERGTLETLLSCPASRKEIVCGKWLTIMVFSIATSLLNLGSMTLTSRFVLTQLKGFGGLNGFAIGPPPLETMGWLILALIPIAALFSALSLALASMARSSKEGQYYLMPLMLGTMPLMLLPMMPSVQLELGTSLIPLTGVVLLLRNLIEGQFLVAAKFAIPIIGVTGICCWLAGLWAIHQFEDERVLFHESEQFDLRQWLVHLFRDRSNLPTVAQAFLCGVLILLLRFFAAFILPMASDWNGLLLQTVISQAAMIAGPAMLMAWLLTRKPKQTLLLNAPKAIDLSLAVLLAFAVHPIISTLANAIQTLYPISEQTLAKLESFQGMMGGAPNIWALLFMMAVLPAVCEELAFRGFILSGLRRMKNDALAILIGSLLFGIAHQMLQQSIGAFVVGLLIGYVSIKTKSIFPCMLYHLVHNSLPLIVATGIGETGGFGRMVRIENGMLQYEWSLVAVCIIAVIAILWRMQRVEKEDAATTASSLPASLAAVAE